MKILTVCSSPYLSLAPITQLLDEAGLAKGLDSKTQSYQQWHEQVFDAYEQDETGLLVEKALKPGKVWQDMAGQLIHINLDKKQWYWSDSKAGWLLDFWNELESQHRFLLIYSPPQIGISQCFLHASLVNEDIESIINSWVNYHLELLRFYHTEPDKCILINFEDCLVYPNEFINICQQSLSLAVNTNINLKTKALINPIQAIEDELFHLIVKEYPQIEQLYEKLKSLATPFSKLTRSLLIMGKKDNKVSLRIVWNNYRKLQQERESLVDNIKFLNETKIGLEKNNSDDKKSLQSKIEQCNQQTKEYETENELMLLQLHQVQEELEHYFLKYQELEQSTQKKEIIGLIESAEPAEKSDSVINAQVIQVKPQAERLFIELINLQGQQQIWSSYRLEIIKENLIYEQITIQSAIKLPLQKNNLLPLQTWPPQTADETGSYWLIDSILLEKELIQSSFYPEDITFLYQLIKQLPQWLRSLEENNNIKNNSWDEYYKTLETLQISLEPVFDLQK